MKKRLTPEQKYQQEQREIKLKKDLDDHLRGGHRFPKTRREFLQAGLVGSVCMLSVPSALQLFSSQVQAQSGLGECDRLLSPSGSWAPLIHVHLSGGAAIHYNTLVLDQDRQLLPTYKNLGLGRLSNFSTRNEFGNVPLAIKDGQFAGPIMAGLFDKAGREAIDKAALVKLCVASQDDSSTNQDSIMGLVNHVGGLGSHLPNLAYNDRRKLANPTAFKSARVLQEVGSLSSLEMVLAPQGKIVSALQDKKSINSVLKLVKRLNASQRSRLADSATGQQLGQIAECAADKNLQLADFDKTKLDPRQNSAVAQAWGISPTTPDNDPRVVQAAVAMNCISGAGGPSKFYVGGYDYHAKQRDEQDAKDLEAGEMIGYILRTAHVMKRPLFLHVTSDGSVASSSEDYGVRFGSDAGAKGSGFFIAYDPAGRPETSDIQIGHFNHAQAVDESFMNTWTPPRAALSVFANYLQWHRKLELLDKVTPGEFDTRDLNKLLKMG